MTTDYAEILRTAVTGYDGKDDDVICLAPAFFSLLSGLLEDRRIDKGLKPLLNAAISYYVSPYDPFPEDFHGVWGLVDDVVMAAHVLSQIPDKECLEDHWDGEGDVNEQIQAVLARKDDLVGERFPEMLAYVGLD